LIDFNNQKAFRAVEQILLVFLRPLTISSDIL
jgi:hypothetical protein